MLSESQYLHGRPKGSLGIHGQCLLSVLEREMDDVKSSV